MSIPENNRQKPPALLLVAGCVAAGKTTFARRLSARLGIPCFCKDHIKEAMAEGMGEEAVARARNRPLSNAAFQLLLYSARQCLQRGRPVILESNFRPEEAAALERLCKECGARALTYRFTGDLPVLHRRFVEREKSGSRHPVHRSHGIPSPEEFSAAAQPLLEFTISGEIIRVDTTRLESVDWEALLEAGEAFSGGEKPGKRQAKPQK